MYQVLEWLYDKATLAMTAIGLFGCLVVLGMALAAWIRR